MLQLNLLNTTNLIICGTTYMKKIFNNSINYINDIIFKVVNTDPSRMQGFVEQRKREKEKKKIIPFIKQNTGDSIKIDLFYKYLNSMISSY
jgi:hypothetical protein